MAAVPAVGKGIQPGEVGLEAHKPDRATVMAGSLACKARVSGMSLAGRAGPTAMVTLLLAAELNTEVALVAVQITVLLAILVAQAALRFTAAVVVGPVAPLQQAMLSVPVVPEGPGIPTRLEVAELPARAGPARTQEPLGPRVLEQASPATPVAAVGRPRVEPVVPVVLAGYPVVEEVEEVVERQPVEPVERADEEKC